MNGHVIGFVEEISVIGVGILTWPKIKKNVSGYPTDPTAFFYHPV